MGKIERFEDLIIWKEARKLSSEIYSVILSDENVKDFALKDQINRSSSSIMDNIAEGFERQGNKEFRQFLTIAKASCGEVKSQLYRSLDRSIINANQFNELYKKTDAISQMIHGFVKYLNSSTLKGSKFINEPEHEYLTEMIR